MSVSCQYCVLSGRGLCVGLITRWEESYRVWRVYLSVFEEQHRGEPGQLGLSTHEKEFTVMLNIWYIPGRHYRFRHTHSPCHDIHCPVTDRRHTHSRAVGPTFYWWRTTVKVNLSPFIIKHQDIKAYRGLEV
jgi:hypothetical protein